MRTNIFFILMIVPTFFSIQSCTKNEFARDLSSVSEIEGTNSGNGNGQGGGGGESTTPTTTITPTNTPTTVSITQVTTTTPPQTTEVPGGTPETPPVVECSSVQETFTQVTNQSVERKVDIVWIIDDSGSMSDDQYNLATNFKSFIEYFVHNNKIDYKMAITSTDYSYYEAWPFYTDGRLYNRCGDDFSIVNGVEFFKNRYDKKTNMLSANYPQNVIDYFKCDIVLGSNGSSYESGLGSLLLLLERSLDPTRGGAFTYPMTFTEEGKNEINGENRDFFRQDAEKVFIIVSDEEDGLQGGTANEPHALFWGLPTNLTSTEVVIDKVKEYTRLISNTEISPVIHTISNKNYVGINETYRNYYRGDLYVDASQRTGGLDLDILDTDFASHLRKLGDSIVNVVPKKGEFSLQSEPDLTKSIKVLFNGEEVSADKWVIKGNILEFTSTENIPDYDTKVTVIYSPISYGNYCGATY